MGQLRIGCAGWAVPGPRTAGFPGPGSQLERYARVLPAVEINTSFYRPHRHDTYERWAASVPSGFRFAVKAPREITHFRRLAGARDALERFVRDEVAGLGGRLGPILVQLPPSLAFEAARAEAFFEALRELHAGDLACEPRHASWFEAEPERLLAQLRVGRVAADPAGVPSAARPGGWSGLVYFRLHGSPQVYRSPYTDAFLRSLASSLAALASADVWCIFDNTAAGAATHNARRLLELTRPRAA